MESYNVIGVMSGTSLDGLDLCYSTFTKSDEWKFNILATYTNEIPNSLKKKLKAAINCSGLELSILNNEVGNYIGNSIESFIKKLGIKKTEIDFISSHGHTIFHQPKKNLTLQIGNGANISAITQLPVICDFRSVDLALNGNGAPLVPIGDKLLFSTYKSCVNLGGIANISYEIKGKRVAFDICPVNMVLNKIANKLNLEYDKNGNIAKTGELNSNLLEKLNQLDYYSLKHPKSLGYEWVSENVFPLLKGDEKDLLHTYTEHIAIQIAKHIKDKSLFTGGGAYNSYLIERIEKYAQKKIILPKKEIIEFKEALIFGLLGVLRWRMDINTLRSVTGSKKDNIGGCIYHPFPIS